jgi:putative tricarboxylic transport membrane protein
MMINRKAVTSIVMLIIFLVFVGQALTFGAQARIMPLLIGIPGIIFCILQILLDARGGNDGVAGTRYFSPGELPVMGWIVGTIVLVTAFGFSFGAPPMVAAYLLVIAKEKLRTAVAGAVVCFLMFYVLFERLMGAQLFHGLAMPHYF